jgi:hypothetical protein
MEFNQGCVICGVDLVYYNKAEERACVICGKIYKTDVYCKNGHYICNTCHSVSAYDFIEATILNTEIEDPIVLAIEIMKHPSVKMHGPEHHFLVPAVLISCFYKANGEKNDIQEEIKKARDRSEHVLGGFCGSHGTCGAGMGAGIFLSVITKNTPVKSEEWKLSNMLTGKCLLKIAEKGGPRCCKRDAFIAIYEAVEFCKDHLGIKIPISDVKCGFSEYNKECLFSNCDFYN